MAKLAVNRDSLVLGGKEYRKGDSIDHDESNREHKNLLASGKLVAAKNIDEKLAREGDTLSEQLEVNRQEAERVMAGPVVASESEEEEAPAKKLTAKSAPKKAK